MDMEKSCLHGIAVHFYNFVTAQLNPTKLKLEWQCNWSVTTTPTHPTNTQTLLHHFQATQEADFRYAAQLDDLCKKNWVTW